MRRFALVLMLILIVGTVSAEKDIRLDIRISTTSSWSDGESQLEDVDPGDTIYVILKITNEESSANITPGDNLDIEISVRDIKVYDGTIHVSDHIAPDTVGYISISSNEFDYRGNWDENLMGYFCGEDQLIEVTLSDDVDAEDDAEVDIVASNDKYELSFSLDPESPGVNDKFKVIVEDGDRDELQSAKVKITELDDSEWDDDDDKKTYTTDSDGETNSIKLTSVFGSKTEGPYQIDVWKSKYCKQTIEIDASKTLIVSNPDPASPQAGKSFKVRVTDSDGDPIYYAKAVLSPGMITVYTNTQGYATFKVDTPGDYQLLITVDNYDDPPWKNIKIVSAPSLSVSVSPSQPKIGEIVTITVKSGTTGIGSASVAITLPGGTSKVLTTSSDGTVTFIPTVSGIYSIDASKEAYSTGTATFIAINTFTVVVPDLIGKKAGDKITITVQDSSGNPVVAATVNLVGTDVSGTTDIKGQYSFNIPSAGAYTLHVTKDGFSPKDQAISLVGKLSIQLSSTEVEIGENVTVTALDSSDNKVSVSIEVTLPDGIIQTVEGEAYIPKVAGNHSITVKKAGYTSDTETLVVGAKSLILDLVFEGNTLQVEATSRGKPVSNLTIEIETPTGVKEAPTDENGILLISAKEKGDYTARAKSDIYEAGTITSSKGGLSTKVLIVILLGLVVLIVLVIIVAAVFHIGRKKGGFDRKGDSKLGK